MQYLLTLFLCAIAGLLFSNIRKIISLRRKGKEIDYNFTVKKYVAMDWDIIVSQVITIVIALLIWKGLVPPEWVKYGELIFVGVGIIGAEILNTFFSKAESFIIDRIKNFTPEGEPKAYGVGAGTVGTTPIPPPPPPPPSGN